MSTARGFTILETVIVAGLSALVLLAVGVFTVNLWQTYRTLDQAQTGQEQTSRIINSISNELRTVSISANGAYPIAEATGSSLTFHSQVDKNPDVEKLRYFVAGASLKRGLTKPTGNPPQYLSQNETITTVVTDITNPTNIFSYFDSSYGGTGSPLSSPVNLPAVRLIKVSLTIDKNGAAPPGPYTIENEINLRNLKDNL